MKEYERHFRGDGSGGQLVVMGGGGGGVHMYSYVIIMYTCVHVGAVYYSSS